MKTSVRYLRLAQKGIWKTDVYIGSQEYRNEFVNGCRTC